VARDYGLDAPHEEPPDDCARPPARPADPPRGSDARPNEDGQCCANSQPRYWLALPGSIPRASDSLARAMPGPSPRAIAWAALLTKGHDLKQLMQLGKEILYPLKHPVQLAQEMLLLAPRCLGWTAHRFLARTGSLLLLPLDEPSALFFFLHDPLQAGLHLPGQMQHMPYIPLVPAECFGDAQG